jgi:hypothetical protein
LAYFLVVKSISFSAGLYPPSAALSHVHASAGLAPQEQVAPTTVEFSFAALSQLHSPAGRARQEHRAPVIVFSEAALSQVQLRADCLPHEQVACLASLNVSLSITEAMDETEDRVGSLGADIPQTHSLLLPQQVDAFSVVMILAWIRGFV